MFECHTEPLAPRRRFFRREVKYFGLAAAAGTAALGIGVLGCHFLAGFTWVDSLLNASMILGGMGPVEELPNDTAKAFGAFHARFSGVVVISVMGLVLAPVAHRTLHHFDLDEMDLNEETSSAP